MADDKQRPEGDEAKPSSGKKTIFLLAGILVVTAGLGAGAYVLLAPGAEAAALEADAPAEQPPPQEGDIIELDHFSLNLADEGETRYARVGLGLVLDARYPSAEVSGRIPILRDAFLPIIMGRHAKDLQSPAGVESLRDALTDAARTASDDKVMRVVITNLIIQ